MNARRALYCQSHILNLKTNFTENTKLSLSVPMVCRFDNVKQTSNLHLRATCTLNFSLHYMNLIRHQLLPDETHKCRKRNRRMLIPQHEKSDMSTQGLCSGTLSGPAAETTSKGLRNNYNLMKDLRAFRH